MRLSGYVGVEITEIKSVNDDLWQLTCQIRTAATGYARVWYCVEIYIWGGWINGKPLVVSVMFGKTAVFDG